MRKLLFLLLVLSSEMYGQNLSPLLNPMSTNLMNDRPEIFREIQLNLDKAISSTGYGFKADYVTDKFESLRRSFVGYIVSPEILLDTGKKTIDIKFKSFPAADTTINYPESNLKLNEMFDELRIKFGEEVLNKILTNSLSSLDNKGKKDFKELMLSSSFDLLKKSELAYGINAPTDDEAKKNYTKAISNLISKIILKKIMDKIRDALNIEDVKFNKIINTPIKELELEILNTCIEKSNKLLVESTENLKAKVNNILDDVQSEMEKVIDEVNKVLLSGNIGIAVSEGSGDFGTGLQFSWNLNSRLQFGAYLNGELSESDTTLPKRSLIAVQGRTLIGDYVQLDLLGSFYFGDQKFKSFKYYEIGGGTSVNINKSVIVGAGYFQLGNLSDGSITTSIDMTRTFGLFIRSTVPTLPIVYIGHTWQIDNNSFGFKITYPINNKH